MNLVDAKQNNVNWDFMFDKFGYPDCLRNSFESDILVNQNVSSPYFCWADWAVCTLSSD